MSRIVAGKYRLVRRVAEGGMGTVWVARNLSTDAEVALKIVWPDPDDDRQLASRFRYEAKLGATLWHRNMTAVYDLVEEDDGVLVLVMELLRGASLADRLETSGCLSNVEAVAIVVQILSALEHAHENGVIHRDLKPSNVVLHVEPDGLVVPKLLDFGIAKVQDAGHKTRAGDVLGTPCYMSPEQVRGGASLDARSDLFAAGVMLYELITGEVPFVGNTASAVLAKVLEEEVDPDPRIDPRVWLEIQRATSKQSYARHASAKELASALCAAVEKNPAELADLLRASEEEVSEKRAVLAADVNLPSSTMATPIALGTSAQPTPIALGTSAQPSAKRVRGIAVAVGLSALLVIALVGVVSTRPPVRVAHAQQPASILAPLRTASVRAPSAKAFPTLTEEPASPSSATHSPHVKGRPVSAATRPVARTPGF